MFIKIDLCADLLKPSDMFGSQGGASGHGRNGIRYGNQDGWKTSPNARGVFKEAAKRGDMTLAKAAIRRFELSAQSLRSIVFTQTFAS
jgi:hypothetical protein